MTHKLMIKTHNITGLKYLCYTRKKDHDSYNGSGKVWKSHLEEHGYNFSTELIFETEDIEEFKKVSIQKSNEYDIINSNEWANLKNEEGDGGDTVSNKRWITDGAVDRYINKDDDIPLGWKLGRSNCVFNDKNKQREFSQRIDTSERSKSIKRAWAEGKMDSRDNSKCGVRGDLNPANRLEVREKISISMKSKSAELSERIKKHKPWEKSSRGHVKN